MRIEEIHQALPRDVTGLHFKDLCTTLGYTTFEQRDALDLLRTLEAYGLVEAINPQVYRRVRDEVTGTLSLNVRGFGFVTPELSDGPNIYIDREDLGGARHRDRVSIRLYTALEDRRHRGAVTRVLEQGTQTCVGTLRFLKSERGDEIEAWLTPQDQLLPSAIRLINPPHVGERPPLTVNDFDEGDLLAVQLINHSPSRELIAIPLHRIDVHDPQGQLESVIYGQGINLGLNPAAQSHAERFSAPPPPDEYARRKDLRYLPFITIDPETAKDFDDAIYVQPQRGEGKSGWRLWVAIADVAHYVTAGDPIDEEARSRSATLYLPAQAFPMLPHRLSNDLCSLRPRVDRLAMVACIDVSAQGDLGALTMYEAVIHSQARLTYDEAASLMGALPPRELPKLIKRQREHVITIRDCARALKSRRRRRGFLNLDLVEPRINFDLQGHVGGFRVSPRHEAHEMVEEAMLAANESVAALCIEHEIPSLYRLHAPPTDRGLERFIKQSELLMAPFQAKKSPKVRDFSGYLKRHKEHPTSELLSGLMLRAMSRAAYDPRSGLHFGLGTATYLHFTSPIRRYPDLWVHRQVKAWMNHREIEGGEEAREIAGYSSRRERMIMEAERRVLDAYKALFMRDHVGEILQGVVYQASPKGFVVQLNDYPIWCHHEVELIPYEFSYHEDLFAWISDRTRQRIGLGSAVEVEVLNADVAAGRVEVALTAWRS